MRHIIEASAHGLHWTQSMSGMHSELHAGDTLVAQLERRSVFGTLATGESADGCWTFKRVGFLQARATIRRCADDADIGVFHDNTWNGGGTLELTSGATFRVTTNFWSTRLAFVREDETPLITFTISGVLKRSADVDFHADATSHRDTPLLVIFGWYLIVMLSGDGVA
ncbi:MAG: hypothetical protein IT353_15150 [Gemmatimonadaceae bacterium]|nr:hypothetical protein [Gemmatimonadaceae bacterium]